MRTRKRKYELESSVLLSFDGHRFANILAHAILYRNPIDLLCICQEDHSVERERSFIS